MRFEFTKTGVATFFVAIVTMLFLKLMFEPWVIEVFGQVLVKCQ